MNVRIATPNLSQENQIHQTGLAMINLFAEDLFGFLNENLQSNGNENWLINYRKNSLNYQNYNFLDPSNLLKEIIRVSNSPLRIPIRNIIDQKDMVAFFNKLSTVLEDRNDWVHHNQSFNKENLKSLILNIYPIATKMGLSIVSECDFLLESLSEVKPDVLTFENDLQTEVEPSEIVKSLSNLVSDSEPQIGSAIDESLTEFSYILHLSGEIRNRKNNELLSSYMPDVADYLGALMIARKPTGGRLRITNNGKLVAYFENHWGFLAQVNPDIWFPEHIHHRL